MRKERTGDTQARSQETAALLLLLSFLPPLPLPSSFPSFLGSLFQAHPHCPLRAGRPARVFSNPPVPLSCGCAPTQSSRVTHEARGCSQDGSVQEAVEGEEADPRGVHPAVPAPPAAHPPHQREYESQRNRRIFGFSHLCFCKKRGGMSHEASKFVLWTLIRRDEISGNYMEVTIVRWVAVIFKSVTGHKWGL